MVKKRYSLFLFLLCLILIMNIFNLSNRISKKEEVTKNISVIMRGSTGENWENMKQGMEQAALDMEVNLRFIHISENNSFQEQISLLSQEEKNDTDAIVLTPADYKKMVIPVQKIGEKIPIVLIESTIDSEQNNQAITCDNKKMGYDLAQEVLRHGNTRKTIMIIHSGGNCSSVLERIEGFEYYMKLTKNKCIDRRISKDNIIDIEKLLLNEQADILVVMDPGIFTKVAKVGKRLKDRNPNLALEIYGVGSGNEIISYLENNYILSLVAIDDFSIGYLGIKNAVRKINGKKFETNRTIRYAITDQEHMYSKENQRLLFPFVK